MGVLRQTFVTSTFLVEECGNGHSFRRETDWRGGFTMARGFRLSNTETAECRFCGRAFIRKAYRHPRVYCQPKCQAGDARRRAAVPA